MADKKEAKAVERVYNVPLRKEYQKAPNWKRTKKAVSALRDFMVRHMKSDKIKIGKEVNEELWKHGIKNPPHHIKVTAAKDKDGVVRVELFGLKKKEPKGTKKKVKAAPKEKTVNVEVAAEPAAAKEEALAVPA